MSRTQITTVWLLLTLTTILSSGCKSSRLRMSTVLHRPVPAEAPAKAVVLSDGQISDIQISMARALEQKGDLTGALDAYKHVLELDPSNADAAWRLAVLYDKQGQPKQSEALYLKALQRSPKNPEILADFGYSLYLKRRWSESEQYFTQALKLSPGNPRIQNNLGLLYSQTDRSEAALAAFQKSGCSHADACANIGLIATMNGNTDTAREMFRKSLADNPACETAIQGLAALDKSTDPADESPTQHPSNSSGKIRLTSLNTNEE